MNLAIGAFMLTLLFIPAISLRLALQRQRHLKQLVQTFSITDTIWLFITVPVITHVILLTIIYLFGYEVKYDLILNIIYNNKDPKIDNETIGLDVIYFLLYTLVAFCLSMIICIWLVNNSRTRPQLAHLLGAGNEWYDLFNGKHVARQHDVIQLDVAISTRESTIIYSGQSHAALPAAFPRSSPPANKISTTTVTNIKILLYLYF